MGGSCSLLGSWEGQRDRVWEAPEGGLCPPGPSGQLQCQTACDLGVESLVGRATASVSLGRETVRKRHRRDDR